MHVLYLLIKGVGKNVYLCNDCRKQVGLADKKKSY